MLYAKVNSERTLASKGLLGSCPACGRNVHPKCGQIVSHHWAHEAADCDPWYEPMTAWHLGWQERFPEHMREVTIGPHRADVFTGKTVIEFQHSPISVEDIKAREAFYGNMVWVFSTLVIVDSGYWSGPELCLGLAVKRKIFQHITKPVYFDGSGVGCSRNHCTPPDTCRPISGCLLRLTKWASTWDIGKWMRAIPVSYGNFIREHV